jgi:cell wall-associated NlpC family hydrolase
MMPVQFHSRSPRRAHRRAIGVLLSAALVGSAVLSMSSATAAPQPTITQVERRIDKLQSQAEAASEDFNETRELLKSVDVRLKAAQAKLTRQRTELAKARLRVGRLASETYRRGELSTLDLVLGDDPDSALAQAGYLPSLGQRQAGAMNRLKEGEKKLAATEAEIKQQKSKAQASKARLKKNKATVNKKLAQVEAELSTLKASDRVTLTASRNRTVDVPSGGGGSASCNGKAVQAPSGAAKAAIAFACAQLGDPYLWAAAGPSRWDCSGLTMKAYAAGNVSLPHSSRMQAGYGTRVSVSNLLPGDLVFFHSPISHVGIYLGDGMMIHAPSSGSVVKIASLYATPTAATRF